jgi:hypothetical protein
MDNLRANFGLGNANGRDANSGRGTNAGSGSSQDAGRDGRSGRPAGTDSGESGGGRLQGRLNASNASERAMERASPNSAVGRINAYRTALQGNNPNLDAAASALARASNKPVTAQTVRDLNARLGVTLTDAQVTTLTERAQSIQRGGSSTPTAPAGSSTAPTGSSTAPTPPASVPRR